MEVEGTARNLWIRWDAIAAVLSYSHILFSQLPTHYGRASGLLEDICLIFPCCGNTVIHNQQKLHFFVVISHTDGSRRHKNIVPIYGVCSCSMTM
jgi:hypothetical protein